MVAEISGRAARDSALVVGGQWTGGQSQWTGGQGQWTDGRGQWTGGRGQWTGGQSQWTGGLCTSHLTPHTLKGLLKVLLGPS